MNKLRLPHSQRGVTLLSLLVGMAVGVFLVGAVLKLYLDTRDGFRMRNAVSEVSENLRFSIDDMRRILVMAGREILAVEDGNASRRPFPELGAGGIVDGGTTGSDTIAIRYRVGPSCGAYQNVPLTERPTMVRFYVDGQNNLVCEMTTYSGSTASTTTWTMASNIRSLKALYGVDDDADGYANRYLTASQVNTENRWRNVVSIRVALMAGSTGSIPEKYREAETASLNVLGLLVDEPDTAHLYHVASTTLAFRNLHPAIQRQ